MDDSDPSVAMYRSSNEAFALAQEAVDGRGDKAAREKRARELNAWLDDHFTAVQQASVQDPGLMRAWSDARLELTYVLSDGELATSSRLSQYIAERKQVTS